MEMFKKNKEFYVDKMVGKRLTGFVLFGVLVVIVMGSLTSGFFHRDDVRDSPVDATVTVENALPTIFFVQIEDVTNGGGVGNVNPISGGVNNAEVRIVVQDANGPGDLPGGIESIVQSTFVGQLPNGGSNIEVYVTSPGTQHPILDVLAGVSTCVIDGLCTNCGGGANRVEYVCTVPMQYYYEPGIWTLNVKVADVADSVAQSLGNNFNHNTVAAIDFSSSGLIWGSISLSVPDQAADGNVRFTNRGNIDFTSGIVTGADLLPSDATGADLPVNAFASSRIDNTQACNEDGLDTVRLSVGPEVVPGITLPFGDGLGGPPAIDDEQMNFCIFEQLDTLGLPFSAPSYSTSGGTAWDISLVT